MSAYPYKSNSAQRLPRVVVIGLASCYGCQLQITNDEAHLLDILSQFELQYWQLTSSATLPEDFDIAIIEGAITTTESFQMVKRIRQTVDAVITIGACAHTAGVPGIAADAYEGRAKEVYDVVPWACGDLIKPRAVSDVIDVDFAVCGCPINPAEFVRVLGRALYKSNQVVSTRTMCGDCRHNETDCFFEKGMLCLGLVTTAGCEACCVNLGRPCKGCRGFSSDANLASAYQVLDKYGISPEKFDAALEIFNLTNSAIMGKE